MRRIEVRFLTWLTMLIMSCSAHAFVPTMSVSVQTPLTPVFHGITNLPDGANLMLTLTGQDTRYTAQSKMIVKDGKFQSQRMTFQGNSLIPGRYKIEILMVTAALNPPNVRAVIGARGEKMEGPLVTSGVMDDRELQYTTIINLGALPKPIESDASYDPIPSGWSISMDNMMGWLAVGTQYCTDRGKCEIVGRDLGNIVFKDGRTIPAEIGCKIFPAEEVCVSARVPVQLLARNPRSSVVIVKKDGRNYAVGDYGWAFERPDGSVVGGPIMIESEGELRPLHYVLSGMTRQAWLKKQQEIDTNRRVQIAGDLSVRGKRCDELVSVTKDSPGAFTATCKVKNRQKVYELLISGLD